MHSSYFVGRIGLLLALLCVVSWVLPTNAQWSVKDRAGTIFATVTGNNGEISMDVICTDSTQYVAVKLPNGVDVHTQELKMKWNDGTITSYPVIRLNGTLLAESIALVSKLRHQKEVQIWVAAGNQGVIADTINLAGSFRAIGNLPCIFRHPTDAEIRHILVRHSMTTYSGSCPCPYSTDRVGRRCGRRSAYSRNGGRSSPLCYPSDTPREL